MDNVTTIVMIFTFYSVSIILSFPIVSLGYLLVKGLVGKVLKAFGRGLSEFEVLRSLKRIQFDFDKLL